MSKFTSPVYLLAFVILVAVLVAETNLGEDGIIYAVIAAAAIVVGVPLLARLAARQVRAALSGKPTFLDHAVSPGGYRRSRLAESEEETARYSNVQPTPNRPLIVDANPGTERALTHVSRRDVQKYEPGAAGASDKLKLAKGFSPPLSMIIGRCLLFLGQRGAGKSNALARFLEQMLSDRPLPALILDYKPDYVSLPEKLGKRCVIAGSPDWPGQGGQAGEYWRVSLRNALSVGWHILEYGRQVVLLLRSYRSLEEAAEVAMKLIEGMFRWAEGCKNPPPALICLDEAQQFLPQNKSVSSIEEETSNRLIRLFERVNSVGRTLGFTLVLSTQRPAQIRKEVISGTEIYVLMRQTYPNDLDIYASILGGRVHRQEIASFEAGEALVYEGGESFRVRFSKRETADAGKTPGIENALAHYRSRGVEDLAQVIGMLDDTDEDEGNDGEDPHGAATERLDMLPPLSDMPNPHYKPTASKEEILLERAMRLYEEQGIKKQSEIAAALKMSVWDVRQTIWDRFKKEVEERELQKLAEE